MKFAHFAHVWGKTGMTPAERFEQLWRELEVADETGFDYGFCVEHHFRPDESWMSAPSLYTVGAAARTKKIRLGGMGHIVPLHHPLRLAEEIAVADQMTHGRLEVGLVPGITPNYFEPFKGDFENRRAITLEFVDFLNAAYTDDDHFANARRIRSTRCITNGCIPIGAPASATRARIIRHRIPRSISRNSNEATAIIGSAKGSMRRTSCGPSAGSACGRIACSPAAISNGGVPIDDENTLSVGWFFNHVPKEREPYVQNRIPHWFSPLKDEKTGRWVNSHIMNQDFIAWVGQGALADRSKEHLGTSDKGVALVRDRLFADMERVEKGEEPMAIMRDAAANDCIELPIIGKKVQRDGQTMADIEEAGKRGRAPGKYFPFLAGQPEEVKRAYEDAMGYKMLDWT